nr:class I SAM-dependent methyltransferase [uncultured Rhodopila sp.]
MAPTMSFQSGGAAAAFAQARSRAAQRYRDCPRFDRFYLTGKLRHDPVYADVFALAGDGFGHVLDAGCGRGQLGVLLLEAGAAETVLALDWNAAHLDQARDAAHGLPFRAERRDLAHAADLPAADTVFLIDILYQLDTAAQDALLLSACRSARSRVVVRTPDTAAGLRSAITRSLEVLGRRVWPHAGARVNPRPMGDLAATMSAAGFAVTESPCWRGTPFANRLLVARR